MPPYFSLTFPPPGGKKIRAVNRDIQIIFITGYNDYIVDGYDVEALHYILKPVRKEKLVDVLRRAGEKLRKNKVALLFQLPDGAARTRRPPTALPFY